MKYCCSMSGRRYLAVSSTGVKSGPVRLRITVSPEKGVGDGLSFEILSLHCSNANAHAPCWKAFYNTGSNAFGQNPFELKAVELAPFFGLPRKDTLSSVTF